MRGDRFRVAREHLTARGDALIGDARRVRFCSWRSRRNQNTRGRTASAASGLFVSALKLLLRALKFLFGARGENFILPVVGENNSGGAKKKIAAATFHFARVSGVGN